MTKKANVAVFQSYLSAAKKQIAMYYAEHNIYPTSLGANNCLTNTNLTPATDTNYCLKSSSGIYNISGDSTDYTLRLTIASTTYKVTKDTQPVEDIVTPITAIGAITGTAQMGQTLTAGAITPAAATVSYQWQSSDTSNGTYTNIAGATSSTYAIKTSDINKYLKLVVTGTGFYSGTQTSIATAMIAPDPDWVIVGTQTWAKKNLNVGTMITGTTSQSNNSIVEKYCYNNDEANCTANGGLYQWNEAMQYTTAAGVQGICPAGSHIPSDADWKTLEMSLSGMTQSIADTSGWRGTDEGTKLKSGGSSGLDIPLAGFRNTAGGFGNSPSYGHLWSSTESSALAWDRAFYSGLATVYRDTVDKGVGFSIRCVKN